MNSVANGKITQNTPFQNIYIPAGAADNGTSFGAAFYVWHQKMDAISLGSYYIDRSRL